MAGSRTPSRRSLSTAPRSRETARTSARPLRLALIRSEFNPTVTGGLERGVHQWLAEHSLTIAPSDRFTAPGAFEIPLLAQELARTGRYDGVICLGCVIKGETAHFEYISLAASIGLMQAGLATGVPIAFGILTVYTDAQARARSSNDAHNKGREAAAACVEQALRLRTILK